MKIDWDEIKRQTNIAKHHMDFADLDPDFFADAILIRSRQGRLVAVGKFKGVAIAAVVFRPLGTEGISVVSMRPASRKERKLHDQQVHLRASIAQQGD